MRSDAFICLLVCAGFWGSLSGCKEVDSGKTDGSDSGEACASGSHGCACKQANECDDGLVCVSDFCATSSGGDVDSDMDGDADGDTDSVEGGDADADTDVDSDVDTDSDTDADTDADTDTDSDGDTGSDTGPGEDTDTGTGENVTSLEAPFIWISNTGEGTLSKVNTKTAKEVARYRTSPLDNGDPSRTSVNLHGDVVVTNRQPSSGPASATKFAANISDCMDRDKDGTIQTSTGPGDVKPWGEDECMLWNTQLGGDVGGSTGARGTAWDGLEDPATGKGGHVFIGTTSSKMVYKLDGDTGKILARKSIPIGAYGGAADGKQPGSFWIVAYMCTTGGFIPGDSNCSLGRVDMDTLETTLHEVDCGYGITIDSKGRVWTAGMNRCVARYDPAKDESVQISAGGINRGIAADRSGSVWAANTMGTVVQVDQETVTLVKNFNVPEAQSLIGMAIDFDGYVWAVAQASGKAFKIDPETYEVTSLGIGAQPYTYSDMTGFQLRLVTGSDGN